MMHFLFLSIEKTAICSGVTAGGRGAGCPPDTSHREISADLPHTLLTGKFLLTYGEKRGKEKRENGKEKKENQKREGGKLKMEGGKITK